MSHEIDWTKGIPAIAYTGDTPWHGYGSRLAGDETLEQWLVAAGMDYKVLSRPIVWNPYLLQADMDAREEHGTPLPIRATNYLNFKKIPKKKLLIRSDTHDPLGVVSDKYKIVQPDTVMEFFRDLIEDQGFRMHTAGVLSGGNRVWALAETGKDFVLPGSPDKLGAYLLLATSYDGKFSTTAQFTSIRVVCNNTLSWSLNQGESQESGIVRIPHTAEFNAAAVKGELGLLGELGEQGWNQFTDNVIKLSEVKVSKKQAVEFFLEMLGVTEDDAAEGKQLLNAKKLLAFYESAPGSQFLTAQNTTWGLVNAVSYFTDHGRRAHNNGTRFNSAAFGEGARMKQRAFDAALQIAEAA